MSHSKAQGTIEYLVIIAAVVVVALVVVALIAGIASPGTTQETSNRIDLISSAIGLKDNIVSTDGKYLLLLKNNTGEAISITGIKVGEVNSNFSQQLFPGDEFRFILETSESCIQGTNVIRSVTIYYEALIGLEKSLTYDVDISFLCEDYNYSLPAATFKTDVCGDGVITGHEACDGALLNSKTCATQGFFSGAHACNSDCTDFNTDGCTMAGCGNNIIDAGEVCDQNAISDQTCRLQGFSDGNISCNSNCLGYNVSQCYTNFCDGNMLAYYTFDDGTARDYYNDKNGTITGAISIEGKKGKGMDFGGIGDYILTPSLDIGGNFTILMWVNSDLATPPTSTRLVENFTGAKIQFSFSASNYNFYIQNGQPGATGGQIVPGKWQFLALTFDNNVAKTYVDGQLIGIDAYGPAYTLAGLVDKLYLGTYQGAPGSYVFDGKMDEFAIFKKTLTDQQIRDLYDNAAFNGKGYCDAIPGPVCGNGIVEGTEACDDGGTTDEDGCSSTCTKELIIPCTNFFGTPGMAAYWKFDGNGNYKYQDYFSNLRALSSYPIESAAGVNGESLHFDGSSNFLMTPAIKTSNAYTILVWVKSDIPLQGINRRLLENYLPNQFALMTDDGVGNTYWAGFLGAPSWGKIAGGIIRPNKWQLVAFEYDGSAGRLFVDGKEVGRQYFTAGTPTYYPIYTTTYANSTPPYMWTGNMDELALFNRALSASEIAGIYNKGLVGKGLCDASVTTVCGNGIVETEEQCDDGGTVNNDGCSLACVIEQIVTKASCDANIPGMVAYYTFDNSKYPGADAYNGLDGDIYNAPLLNNGKVRSGIYFDGVNGYFQAPDNYLLDMNEGLSASWWIKYPAYQGSGTYFFTKGTSVLRSFAFYITNTGEAEPIYYDSANGIHYILTSGQKIPPGVWTHLTMVVDPNNLIMKYYVNGTSVASTAIPNTATQITNGPLEIAHESSYSLFNGSIDEFALWGRALTDEEVLQIYNNSSDGNSYCGKTTPVCGNGIIESGEKCDDGGTASGDGCSSTCQPEKTTLKSDCLARLSGVAGYWSFDDGNVTDDYNSNNATLINGGSFKPAKKGYGMRFDSNGTYAEIPNDASLNFTAPGMTISAWVKFNSDSPVTSAAVSKVFNAAAWNGYIAGAYKNQLYFIIGNGLSSATASSIPILGRGEWIYATYVWETNGNMSLYANGQKLPIQSQSGLPYAQSISNAAKLYFGKNGGYEGDVRALNGEIDEMIIFRRPLGQTEIQQLYNKTVNNKSYCDLNVTPTCGNGIVETGEECDDGGTINGDGCSLACVLEKPFIQADCNINAPGMIGYWRMDNNYMLGMDYYSSNNGVLVNTTKVLGKLGSALYFDGATSDVRLNANMLDSLGAITVTAWVKSNNPQPSQSTIVGFRSQSGNSTMLLGVSGVNPTGYTFSNYKNGSQSFAIQQTKMNYGQWEMVTGTWDGITGMAKIYVNGVLQDTNFLGTFKGIMSQDDFLRFGWDDYMSYWRYSGAMDEIAIFNRELSQSEIRDLYNKNMAGNSYCSATPLAACGNSVLESTEQCDDGGTINGDGCSSTCAVESNVSKAACDAKFGAGMMRDYWTFDNNAYPFYDDYKQSLNLNMKGTILKRPGKVGAAMDTRGVMQDILVANDSRASYMFPSGAAFSYGAWVKSTGALATNGIMTTRPFSQAGYLFWIYTNKIGCVGYNTSSSAAIYSDNTISVNVWYHAMCVYDGTTLKLYVNSIQQAQTAAIVIDNTNIGEMTFGDTFTPLNPGYSSQLYGTIDEAALFGKALSGAEIIGMYNNGLAGKDICQN